MRKVSNWDKFRLLLWKNWLLQLARKRNIIFEYIIPLLLALFLLNLRSEFKPHIKESLIYKEKNITNSNIIDDKTTSYPSFELLYSPKNVYLDNIVKAASQSLEFMEYRGYDNKNDLETALITNNASVGIEFDDSLFNITDYPKKLKYSIRFPTKRQFLGQISDLTWCTTSLFPEKVSFQPRQMHESDGGSPIGYLKKGFLSVQQAISTAFIKLKSGEKKLPEIVMQRYPFPEYISDSFDIVRRPDLMSVLILLCFSYSVTSLTKSITIEKEKQLKEIMKIMGLQNWIHWSAWFVKAFTIWGISAVLLCITLTIPVNGGAKILTYSSWSVILAFLLVYIITGICFCFMMAVFFNKANTAAIVSSLVWIISHLPFSMTLQEYNFLTLGNKLFYCLFVNSGMSLCLKVILGFELTHEGVHWSNLFDTYSADDNLSLGAGMGMMLLSSIIYMTICLYVEQVFPGDYGMPKVWYFPLTKSYWFGEPQFESSDVVTTKMSKAFEANPVGKQIGVRIKNLRKNFGNYTAVRDLSLDMYKNEITVLLGHNGAGKTTTISMLTGMIPPTSGTAIINDYDIRVNTEDARSSMGICPQQNVLFDEMSVANHIVFFCRLKGVQGENIQKELKKYLKLIELENKADVASSKLSGGMKRKLSVCCALCGDTKVVLCDEPSSGMDPAARRQLWDLLQAEKNGRTLLLTTHFMDEADVLGDRIAIMCDGELKCHGTSFFLKKIYGSGYRLICVKHENCIVSKVTALLNEYIPEIEIESKIGAELTYQLPETYSSVFENMFSALEEKSDELNLEGYGIGITSLEDVFIKVGAENTANVKNVVEKNTKYLNDIESTHANYIFVDNVHLLKGKRRCLNQWKAMLLKEILYTWRNRLKLILQNLIPILLVALCVLILWTEQSENENGNELVPMEFSLKQYPIAITVLENTQNVINGSLAANISKYYKSIANSYGEKYTFESTGKSNFSDYILNLGKTIQVKINSRYLAAATIDNDKIIAWLNNQPYHTAPLTVNLVHNALAKALLGDSAEIRVINKPFDNTEKKELGIFNSSVLSAVLPFMLCIAMSFVSAFYVFFAIKERVSRAKLLQLVSGVNIWTYWLSQLLWDMMTFTLTSVIVMILLIYFHNEESLTYSLLVNYFGILLIYGISVLPFTYLLSFIYDIPATGFTRVSSISIFTGLPLAALFAFAELIHGVSTRGNIFRWMFRLIPHFSFSACVLKLRNLKSNPNIFKWTEDGILPEIAMMLSSAVIYFLIIILREQQVVSELMHKILNNIIKPPPLLPPTGLDDDVERERNRILQMSTSEAAAQNLLLDRVTKYYNKFLAVNQVSFCVKDSECFGLLGVNGAGKTSIFKMLTGDERISNGMAYVKGLSLKSQMNQVYKEIGYCPQFDALIDDLTGRELLRIFCLLRGVPTESIDDFSENLAIDIGFMNHMDKLTKNYSGGNKRKLSTAIAVIGTTSVIYLDEPTSGMDPAARRQLWNVICQIRDSGKSIVLTSHSMEECEALCTRLAIMVKGELKCIGSTQHLKIKFSKGLILKIKVKSNRDSLAFSIVSEHDDAQFSSVPLVNQNSITNVKDFVAQQFPLSILQDENQGFLTFYISKSCAKWSRIFGLIERHRRELNIDDYSISQTTLEEVFLEIANQ